jgi:hypothetical protein
MACQFPKEKRQIEESLQVHLSLYSNSYNLLSFGNPNLGTALMAILLACRGFECSIDLTCVVLLPLPSC